MESEQPQSQFKGWAVIEIFGHTRAAGFVTTEYFGSACLFRIDTPDLPEREYVLDAPEYVNHKFTPAGATVKRTALEPRTKMIGPSSIFSLNPCTEEAARAAIEQIYPRPLMLVRLPERPAIAAESEQKHRAIDPVCGSEVDIVEDVPTYDYGAQTWVFCSPECLGEFIAAPDDYIPEPAKSVMAEESNG